MLTYVSNGMDVVVECLTMLENDPHFNAGKGAAFNDQKEVELDALLWTVPPKWRSCGRVKAYQEPCEVSAGGHGGNLTRLAHWRGRGVCQDSGSRVCDNEYFNNEAKNNMSAGTDEEERYRRGGSFGCTRQLVRRYFYGRHDG